MSIHPQVAPTGWHINKIKEIGKLYAGSTPSTFNDAYWGGDIVWLVPSDLTALNSSQIYISDSEMKITKAGFESCATTMLPLGAICMSSRATLGECAIASVPLCTNQGFINVVCSEELDNRFLIYWVKQNKTYISRFAAGTTFLEIGRRTFGNLRIVHPEKKEQEQIASILYRVDEAILSTKETIAKAERLKKALMQNLLTGRLRPDGTWRQEEDFKPTKLGSIPKDWGIKKAMSVCIKVTDGTHDTPSPSNSGNPLVTSKNLTGSGIDLSLSYLISHNDFKEINKRSKVDQYDILYGMIGTIGNPEIVMDEEITFAIKNVGLFKTGGDLQLAKWINNYLQSPIYSIYLHRMQAGTTQSFISLTFLRKLPIIFPLKKNEEINWHEVIAINKKFDSLNAMASTKKLKLEKLERLKKALMQNLLTGKVRVKIEK